MPTITLPDGSTRQYPEAVSVMDVAADIGPGLAKATLAGIVDGEIVDASHAMTNDASLSVITNKSDEALPLLRHSTAHLLAQAVKQLFPTVLLLLLRNIYDNSLLFVGGEEEEPPPL